MNEPLTKDKIHLCVNAACKQGEHVDIADVASAVRLLREKIEEMLTDLRGQVKRYEESESYCRGERIQALWFVKHIINEVLGGVEG